MELLKFKNNTLAIWKNYRALCEKQSGFIIQRVEESTWKSFMTTLRKTVLSIKLLFLICLSKTKKQKEFTTQLWVSFELFLLNKSFSSYYRPKL